MKPILRDYQEAALDAIEKAHQAGVQRPLLALPTGTGKTMTFCELIRRRGPRALVLVHRDELVHQTVDHLRRVAPHLNVGIVKAILDETDAEVVVACVQTLHRPTRLKRVRADFKTIVVDEAHHAAAKSYWKILDTMGAFNPGGPLLLGVTATPERGDRVGLDNIFEQIVYQKSLLEMMEAGWLCDLRALRVTLKVDFNALRVRAGDFVEEDLAEMLTRANAPKHIVAAHLLHAAGRRTLVFTPTVAVAEAVAVAFCAANVPAESLSGETSTTERRAILARLKTGVTQVVANCQVLTEGFDEERLGCIVVARPTKSRPFYAQMIGRGTRKSAGKDDCLILDLVGATERHDLVTASSLLGFTPREDETVLEYQVRTRVEREAALLAEAERAILVTQQVALFHQQRIHWAVAPEGDLAVLSLGRAGNLILKEHADGWAVIVAGPRFRDERGTLIERTTLDNATAEAERIAKKKGSPALYDPEAEWRDKEPSDKQRAWTLRKKITITGMTRGQVNDLMSIRREREFGNRPPLPPWVRQKIDEAKRRPA